MNTLKTKTWLTIAIIVLSTAILVAIYWYVNQVDRIVAIPKVYATGTGSKSAEFAVPEESRAKKLQDFLVSKSSPLAPYAEYIVEQSDKNDIPWTLSVSISGKESSFGKAIRPGSNNAWGFMTWSKSGERSIKMFPSWEAGITAHIELLGNHYKKDMNAGIQKRYCPSFECSETWVSDVTKFSEEIKE